MKLTLTKVKPTRRLTWLGRILLTALVLGLLFAAAINLYAFLAPENPPHKGVMVIEGWIHDFALDEAVSLYRTGDYSRIVCTGVPIETGSYIQQFKSYPEMTAARLRKMGVPKDEIVVAIADDHKKDRTYLSAQALRQSFMAYNIGETNLHLVTVGPHGRRSRMLFEKALGEDYHLGVTCLEPSTYNESDWYFCSEGVRNVLSETIAYIYAKFFFHP